MEISPEKEKQICEMFDSFCKTVIRNCSRNLKRAAANQRKHFSTGSISVQQLLSSLTIEDERPSDQYVIYVENYPCVIKNEILYYALNDLKEKQRNVILMDYWLSMTDEEISKRLEVTRCTVYNLRNRALSRIRRYYEEHGRDP